MAWTHHARSACKNLVRILTKKARQKPGHASVVATRETSDGQRKRFPVFAGIGQSDRHLKHKPARHGAGGRDADSCGHTVLHHPGKGLFGVVPCPVQYAGKLLFAGKQPETGTDTVPGSEPATDAVFRHGCHGVCPPAAPIIAAVGQNVIIVRPPVQEQGQDDGRAQRVFGHQIPGLHAAIRPGHVQRRWGKQGQVIDAPHCGTPVVPPESPGWVWWAVEMPSAVTSPLAVIVPCCVVLPVMAMSAAISAVQPPDPPPRPKDGVS